MNASINVKIKIANCKLFIRSLLLSSPFPTRWGQRPEFLISIMFCPGHPPGWSAVPACPFGRNPSIFLLVYPLVFFLALSCQQLLSFRCFLPFSAYVHTSVVSFLWLSLLCYSRLASCIYPEYQQTLTKSTADDPFCLLLMGDNPRAELHISV